MSRFRRIFAILGLLTAALAMHAPAADAPPTWAALSMLDDISDRCIRLMESKELAQTQRIIPSLQLAAKTVVTDPMPETAKHPEQLTAGKEELKGLAAAMEALDPSDAQGLASLLAKVHTLAGKMLDAAGIPRANQGR